MPSLCELPDDLSRVRLCRAIAKLGFEISSSGGKGSHTKATHTKTQKCVIIPSPLPKHRLKYVLREIEQYSGVTWDDVKEKL